MRSLLWFAALAACKSGGSTTPTTTPEAVHAIATIARGPATFGCFAWSEPTHAFACVTGSKSLGSDSTFELRYVGSPASADPIVDPIADPAAKELDASLARDYFWKLDGTGTSLTAGTPHVDGGVTLAWTRTGNDHTVTATCGATTTKLFESKDNEDGFDVKLTARTAASVGLGLLEIASHMGREGESTDAFEAVVYDTATCTILGR